AVEVLQQPGTLFGLLQLRVPPRNARMGQTDVASWLAAYQQPRAVQLHPPPPTAGIDDFQVVHGSILPPGVKRGGWRGGGNPVSLARLHPPPSTSNHRSIRHDRPARDDDDAVTDDVVVAFRVGQTPLVHDTDVRADATVLVYDGSLDRRIVADCEIGNATGAIRCCLG